MSENEKSSGCGRRPSVGPLSIIALTFLLLLSCAPKKPVVPAPEQREPGYETMAEADRRLAAGRKRSALRLYDQYIERFADGPALDEALFKAGTIRQDLGMTDRAKADFLALVGKFPDSPLSGDALMALVEIFYRQGKYEKVIQYASEVMKRPLSAEEVYRVYLLLGDTHLALGAAKDAVMFFAMAGRQAGAGQQVQIRSRMKEAVRQLQTPDIEALLARIDDPLAEGYLRYQLGLEETEADNFEAATDALLQFVSRFPDHEYAADARALVEEIDNSYSYRSNVIGCLLPLSGPYKLYGNRALKGIELALHRLAPDPTRPQWQLIVRDTGSDPKRAISGIQEFFAEKVAAVIGPIITAEEAAQEAQALGIPIVVFSQKDEIPAAGSFVFRNFMTPRMQVQALLSHLVREKRMRRFGVLFPAENYGRTFMSHFWDQAVELGAEVVAAHPYDGEKTDFAGPIGELVGLGRGDEDRPTRQDAADLPAWGPEGRFLEEILLGMENRPGPGETAGEVDPPEYEDLLDPAPIVDFDALFIPDSAPRVAMIVPQLAYYDVTNVVLLGTNLWHSERLLETAGQYLQGALISDGYFAESTSGPVVEFTEAFRGAYGQEPGFISAVAHDTASILFDIVGRSRSRFRSGLRDALLTVQNYPAVTGPTSFDENGEARKRLYLIQIKGNGFREIPPGDGGGR